MVAIKDRSVQLSLSILEDLLGEMTPRDFTIRLWEGTVLEAEQPARFTLILNHPGSLRKMFFPPTNLTLSEAYIYEDFDIEGDMEAVLETGLKLLNQPRALKDNFRLAAKLMRLPSGRQQKNDGRGPAELAGERYSKSRDSQAVTYHYSISNDFYKLWLDKNMVYSCAYFASPEEDLETAQERKLDMLCRKLRLKPGEKLLDIGCGWGGLILHAAKNYGVTAVGITLSQPQADLANERIHAAGLADRCRAEVRDYRDMDGEFDKLVSVGMFEHVGKEVLPLYFKQAWSLLRPGGVFLNHGIARDMHRMIPPEGPGKDFIDRYIFPDGSLVPLHVTSQAAMEAGFEVRDVECLREHYAMTLQHWIRRFEANADAVRQTVDKTTFRVWWLYLNVARYGFLVRAHTIYQILLAKPEGFETRLPLTRADWYLN